ncbi:DEAD/DEAH box helicase family protein [Spiroplasma endosymbiont of Panorpa germanica]|uniref:DEAD/DEAH box helicase family protein n=1 Tax=Spiroplasma endosymbiont of Panorpa germanica TaxID=3066314 RepID=UPI0030CE91A9
MIFTDLEHKKLIKTFKDLIAKSHEIKIISPFITKEAFNLFYEEFESFFANNGKLQILTTTYNKAASSFNIDDLAQINKFNNTQIKVQVINYQSPIHMKVYVFNTKDGIYAISGSSNMTNKGLTSGEINFSFVKNEEAQILNDHFNYMWDDCDNHYGWINFSELDPNDFMKFDNHKAIKAEVFKPLLYQEEVIDVFKKRNQLKNLIVLPTGTGKTYLAAFIYQEIMKKMANQRILFISHRQEIIINAKAIFEKILKLTNTTLIKGGWIENSEELKNNHLFVVDKSLNNLIDQKKLQTNDFGVIYFDEAHHLDGKSETNIIAKIENYFKAQYKIALTATPERMDKFDITTIFGKPIYEMRLNDALENNLVAPLNYFLINDDSTVLDNQDLNSLDRLTQKINTKTRNDLILQTIEKRISYIDNNCVIFCTTIEHAQVINQMLLENNYKSAVLTSEDNKERSTILENFKNQKLNFLCVVDILNEGVDIPNINNVIFARPTNSSTVFLQQLGRGLRKQPDKVLNVFDLVANINNDSYWYNRLANITNLVSDKTNNNYQIQELQNVNLVYDQLSYQKIIKNLAMKWDTQFNKAVGSYKIRKTLCYDDFTRKELVVYFLFNKNSDNKWANILYQFSDSLELFDNISSLEKMDLRSLEDDFKDLKFFNFMKKYQDENSNGLNSEDARKLVIEHNKKTREYKLLYNFVKLVEPEIEELSIGEILTKKVDNKYLSTITIDQSGYLLKSGSHFKPYGRKIYEPLIEDLWSKHCHLGNLIDKENNIFILKEDLHFPSRNLLAQFVIGGNASFPIEFNIERLGISIQKYIVEKIKKIIS